MQNLHFWLQHLTSDIKFWHLVKIFEIPLLHIFSNDACRFAINLFPISWEPSQNVNLFYFLLWMQIWNGCNAFYIAENPIKDINAKLTFLTSASKVVEWTPQPMVYKVYKTFTLDHIISVSDFIEVRSVLCMGYGMDPPVLTSGGNLGNSTFACPLQWCMQICHKPFPYQLRAIWKC